MYLSSIGGEDLQFRPIEIVLGQGANLLIKLRAAFVIEILRWQPFLSSGQAKSHIARKCTPVLSYIHVMKLKAVVGNGLGLHRYPLPRPHSRQMLAALSPSSP